MSLKTWAATKAAGPLGAAWSVFRAVVSILGGWRATLWFAGLLWFAWQAHANGALADRLQRQTDAARQAAQVARAERDAAQGRVTVRVVTKYVDRIKVVRERAQTIVKEVPIYVPSGLPALPGSFRVFHDAAAAGVLPDPAGVADAAPVDPQAVAGTVADNYGTCHETAEQLTALQDWIRQQAAVK